MPLDNLEVEVHIIIRDKDTDEHAPAFGRGVARLCEGVEQTGSLNKACKQMGMAYSKAWRILRNAEESLGVTLLVRQGPHGSVLTEEAKVLVAAFRQTEQALTKEAQLHLQQALK